MKTTSIRKSFITHSYYTIGYILYNQLLKKWGDNDIWINIRNTRNGYSGLMNVLIHDDVELLVHILIVERTLEEVQELKIKITEIFTSYTINVLLEDIRGIVIFDVLENNPSDNRIKNILTTHKSMGDSKILD